ncbi:hypothetical protein B0H13DRAFT_2041389 [Mycena leptocephala]|nr:hypothetical protein B0H13DRAFT_2041389 [Mycena leptocephala]
METMNAIIFVHPANPLLETAGTLVLANPTVYPQVTRTFMDLALSSTLQNLTQFLAVLFHQSSTGTAYALPLKTTQIHGAYCRTITGRANPNDTTAIMEAFHTRCWWDSAGITYAHQLGGLLAYNISPSFLLYGSDYPWIPAPLVDPAFDAIATSPFLDDAQKQAMRSENIKRLFKGKIEF